MKNYAVLKIQAANLGAFLTGSDHAALMLDKTFETSWEAQEYVNSKKEISDIFYFIWFVSETELAMFTYEEEES